MIEKGFGTNKATDMAQSFNRANVVEMSQLIDDAGAEMFVALFAFGALARGGLARRGARRAA